MRVDIDSRFASGIGNPSLDPTTKLRLYVGIKSIQNCSLSLKISKLISPSKTSRIIIFQFDLGYFNIYLATSKLILDFTIFKSLLFFKYSINLPFLPKKDLA